nr:MAG TPA: restriction alleviation protein [Bacteriophage sp.]
MTEIVIKCCPFCGKLPKLMHKIYKNMDSIGAAPLSRIRDSVDGQMLKLRNK